MEGRRRPLNRWRARSAEPRPDLRALRALRRRLARCPTVRRSQSSTRTPNGSFSDLPPHASNSPLVPATSAVSRSFCTFSRGSDRCAAEANPSFPSSWCKWTPQENPARTPPEVVAQHSNQPDFVAKVLIISSRPPLSTCFLLAHAAFYLSCLILFYHLAHLLARRHPLVRSSWPATCWPSSPVFSGHLLDCLPVQSSLLEISDFTSATASLSRLLSAAFTVFFFFFVFLLSTLSTPALLDLHKGRRDARPTPPMRGQLASREF